MRKLISIFMFVFFATVLTYGQAAVQINLSFTDGVSTKPDLAVGLDLAATNGLDEALGEMDLPPLPPAGAFDVRFDLQPYSGQQLSSHWDFRAPGNSPAFPFTGSTIHTFKWQLTDGYTKAEFGYSLPPEATMNIKDAFGGGLFNSGELSGTGTFNIPAAFLTMGQAIITMTYTNIGPVGPPEPIFDVSPASLSFGTVNVGNNSSLSLTVNNTGNADLNVSGIVSSNPQFTFSPSSLPAIPAGGNAVVNVTFTPTAAGAVSGTLTFTHNASGSPSVVNLSGTGYQPAPAIGFTPSSLSFGNVAIGGSSTLQFTVNNSGDADLTITGISSSDAQYTFSPSAFPVNIAAGGSAAFDVTFTPTAAGSQNASLSITHNAAGSPSSYALTGNGFTTAPFFEINPASLNFGSVSVGGSATLSATVTNSGNAPLQISGVASTDPQFTFAPNTFPITVAPLGNTVFNVTFTPASAGAQSGNITFTHNATGSPSNLPVQGTGQTQGGTLRFIESSRTLYDGTTNNQDTIVLSGYTGQPLKALQFDILIGNVEGYLVFNSITAGSAVGSDFWFDYQVYPGTTRADGSHIDTVKVVLLGSGSNVINPNPGDQQIAIFSYNVVSIVAPHATTYNSLNKVTGATATPVIDANISTGPWETLTIHNGTPWGLLGDVTLDGQVDIADILLMIDYILGRVTFNAQQMTQGDIAPWTTGALLPTPDGVINVMDLAVLQNIVLTGLYPSGYPVNKVAGIPFVVNNNSSQKLSPGMDVKLTFHMRETGITVNIESEQRVKGVQIELNGVSAQIPVGTEMNSVFNQALYYQLNDFVRTLTYDSKALPLDAGEYLLASLPVGLTNPKDIEISKIIVIDENNQKMSKIEVEVQYDDQSVLPLDYWLSQNFPNPFNPSTSVQFSVPVDGFVTIKVYNLLGQEIAALFSGDAQMGTYTLNWNGKDHNGNIVSSGSYIYKMTAGDFVQSKKMTFLK